MSVIDDYLKAVPEPQKAALERVRAIIQQAVPEATEAISYGMPTFKYQGRYLMGFAPFKNHMSIFPGAEPVETMKDKLASFTLSKGTIQFTLDKPLPEALLKEIVLNCLARISKK